MFALHGIAVSLDCFVLLYCPLSVLVAMGGVPSTFICGATERRRNSLRVADSPARSLRDRYIRFGRALVSVARTAIDR